MEAFNFYGENVANFYRHFDEFKTQARYFLTPLPFEVKYVLSTAERKSHLIDIPLVQAPIPIGALFLCWQNRPDLFLAPGSTPEKKYFIYSFNGSPFSGANCWDAVCLETGERVSGKDDKRFLKRCACLDEAIRWTNQALADYKRRKKVDVVLPATLEDLAELCSNEAENP